MIGRRVLWSWRGFRCRRGRGVADLDRGAERLLDRGISPDQRGEAGVWLLAAECFDDQLDLSF